MDKQKVLLVAINSKYIHTNIAVRSLKAYCNYGNMDFMEFSVNESIKDILQEIYNQKPDYLCFSCYIWNIEFVKKLSCDIKKINPSVKIIMGGPEVSYDFDDILINGYADIIIRGEGELILKSLCDGGFNLKNARGISYFDKGKVINNPDSELIDVDELPFFYTEAELKSGRILYYEGSRGCPYRCSYCLSSLDKTVRVKSCEKVCKELMIFDNAGVKLVKLTDRTFNANKEWAKKIIKYLSENAKTTSYHFEIEAHALDDELTEMLANAPKGRFQLEIGVQSTNKKALAAINRSDNFKSIKDVVKKIKKKNNIKVHLDLIAGLPYEKMESFKKSFNDVFGLRADELQLGFLKLLKGTKIRDEAQKYGYEYESTPVYEILKNKFISYEELCELKGISQMLEKYYNSGVFKRSTEYLISCYKDSYNMFYKLYSFYSEKGIINQSISRDTQYVLLHEFGEQQGISEILDQCIKYDYFANNKAQRLPFDMEMVNDEFFSKRLEFIEKNRKKYFSEFDGISAKEAAKRIVFADFSVDVGGKFENTSCIYAFIRKNKSEAVNIKVIKVFEEKKAYVYMVRCDDNSIYTGYTTDLKKRITSHYNREAACAKYTKNHRVVSLDAAFSAKSKVSAMRLEYAIKQLSKAEKEELIKNNDIVDSLLENESYESVTNLFDKLI